MRRPREVDRRALQSLVSRLFPGTDWHVERVPQGVSTPVYHGYDGPRVFYVRLGETPEASLAPEAHVHRMLHAQGVRVPEVVHFEPFDEALQRSVLVTAAIPGVPLSQGPSDAATPGVLRAAGADLAVINGLRVHGFGWIRRDRGETDRLVAEHRSRESWAMEYRDAADQLERAGVLTTAQATVVHGWIDGWVALPAEPLTWLAHGDFDVSHIYQSGGRYTGIIDFGEIRGADRLYDLAHFQLYDGETLPVVLLPTLLAGYQQVVPLSADDERQIRRLGLVIGLRALARRRDHPPGTGRDWLHRRVPALLSRLEEK